MLQKSVMFSLPAIFKQYFWALETSALIAVVNRPSFKTKTAFFEFPLSLNAIFLSPEFVGLYSLEPVANKLANDRINILGLLLHWRLIRRWTSPEPIWIIFRKGLNQRQYLINILSYKIFIFDGIFQLEILLLELVFFEVFADRLQFGLQHLLLILFLIVSRLAL